jgi:glycosyltransferase involved in cell wall biosynthesis
MKRENFQPGDTLMPPLAATQTPCAVSIIIKALNEEKGIATTLQSALRALKTVGGEVILADACSSDRTVEIARGYPVRIVQLTHPHERCCGIGPQLGYQHARGEFIYLVDGDMQLLDGFLPLAIEFLRSHPAIAGVGGRVLEMNLDNPEYQTRKDKWAQGQPGPTGRLDGGGVYRRQAIEDVAYFSNRNLHSYEEFDLAARLRSRGWELWRMPLDAVSHYGHETPALQLLWRRWRSGYLWGLGELLRASLGHSRLGMVLQEVREVRIYAAVLLWWLALAALWLWPASLWPAPLWPGFDGYRAVTGLALLLTPLALMVWRKRSLSRGLYAVLAWSFNAAGMLRGLLRRPQHSQGRVDSRLLQDVAVMTPEDLSKTHLRSLARKSI